jgi:hypothetical protein
MWLYVALGVVALLAVLAVVVAMQPAGFKITRTMEMRAPASEIFPHINDMREWLAWSPWEKLDPTMKREYDGAAGVGQVYSWEGNKNVGAGRCTIVDSRPDELVRMRLEMFKPFAADNDAVLALQPTKSGTAVTWSMAGKRNFFFKAMGLVMSMDKMCGGAFEQGLTDLKEIVEGETAAQREPALAS